MKIIALAAALTIAAAACSQASPASDSTSNGTARPSAQAAEPSSEVTGVPYAKIVGQWQFVYDDARRAIYEGQLAAKISDAAELAKAKREAEEEAAVSVIEFTKDGFYVSYIDGKEIFRANVNAKTPPGVKLTLRDDRTLVMHDPSKGDLIFTRR